MYITHRHIEATLQNITVIAVAEGLITYIRTDSPAMDADTLQGVRHGIATVFGKEYLADDAIMYK